MIEEQQATVYYAPTAGRRFLTPDAAIKAEARARIRKHCSRVAWWAFSCGCLEPHNCRCTYVAWLREEAPRKWVPASAAEYLEDWLRQGDEADGWPEFDGVLVSAIRQEVAAGCPECETEGEFCDWYWDTFGGSPEDVGYDYNPNDADLLYAIQKTFARLYAGKLKEAGE